MPADDILDSILCLHPNALRAEDVTNSIFARRLPQVADFEAYEHVVFEREVLTVDELCDSSDDENNGQVADGAYIECDVDVLRLVITDTSYTVDGGGETVEAEVGGESEQKTGADEDNGLNLENSVADASLLLF
jgi:hypothetical protein